MKTLLITGSIVVLSGLLLSTLYAQERTHPSKQREELGKVSWYRDYDTAVQLAATQNKAVLLLFQEVPGCSTCRNYGHDVLTHPLMVEAIEQEFVPLAIFNNKGGKDKAILDLFKEPSWNNPVVRIIDATGHNLVDRVAGNYSIAGLYTAMITALAQQNQAIPPYMQLLGAEIEAVDKGNIQEQYYQMYCFWSGEKHLGATDGVLSTEAGFMNGAEVVKVVYDGEKITPQQLHQYAKQADCHPVNKHKSYRPSPKDQYYYLQQTKYSSLPLSEVQKTKVNAAIGNRESVVPYLSVRQFNDSK